MGHAAGDATTNHRSSAFVRYGAFVVVPLLFAALVIPGEAVSSQGRGGGDVKSYNYFGDTSQKNHGGAAAHIRVDLQGSPSTNTYSLLAEWGVFWQGGAACNVFDHVTRVTAHHVHITGSTLSLNGLSGAPGNHTASLTVHFNGHGHISGTFTDTVSNGSLTCTSGTVSFTAHNIG
jgi:hypothetical protein